MSFLLAALNVAPLVALVAIIPALVIIGADTFRECAAWTPPTSEIPPAWRVLPRRPYDFESEA